MPGIPSPRAGTPARRSGKRLELVPGPADSRPRSVYRRNGDHGTHPDPLSRSHGRPFVRLRWRCLLARGEIEPNWGAQSANQDRRIESTGAISMFWRIALPLLLAAAAARAQSPVPPDAEIRRILTERVDERHNAVGMVVAVIEPSGTRIVVYGKPAKRSEEHTSELQSLRHLVCRLLLEK